MSPYMLVCAPVAQKHRTPLPDNVRELPLYDRLYLQRSTVPAITHVDGSARIQSVSHSTNPRYWGLIDTFRREQGCPMVVNTSFNVRGEPSSARRLTHTLAFYAHRNGLSCAGRHGF